MNASANGHEAAPATADAVEYKKDFWDEENLRYSEPHFRAQKVARLINRVSRGKECDLLDVGCGPGALRYLLRNNVHYYGIDIAIHQPAPNLIEADLLESPIKFADKQFDIIVAQGVFEYFGTQQIQKFTEIKESLASDGRFILSYWNFDHRNTRMHQPFNNVQPMHEFRASLAGYFNIISCFPASHNWRQNMSDRKFLKFVNMHANVNIPLVSPKLAVEYFFICSQQNAALAA
jgi:cyclopropane fatty-acyl-phospholipid synthase-like methyltransferase